MNKLRFALLSLILLTAAAANAQPLKIGFIDGFRIENESEATKRAIEQIKKEFAPREQQLQAMQKQGMELKAEYDRDGAKMKPAEAQAKEKRLAALSPLAVDANAITQAVLSLDARMRVNELSRLLRADVC